MKTIYVVTSGSYSDYGINAVFDDEQLAKDFIAMFEKGNYIDMQIEEWKLNPEEENIRAKRKLYFLRMNKEGIASDISIEGSSFSIDYINTIQFDNKKNLMVRCFADDEKHAIKIANEKRVQVIANNKWK
jgi:hypothetical protein